jgi:hypothetical protein
MAPCTLLIATKGHLEMDTHARSTAKALVVAGTLTAVGITPALARASNCPSMATLSTPFSSHSRLDLFTMNGSDVFDQFVVDEQEWQGPGLADGEPTCSSLTTGNGVLLLVNVQGIPVEDVWTNPSLNQPAELTISPLTSGPGIALSGSPVAALNNVNGTDYAFVVDASGIPRTGTIDQYSRVAGGKWVGPTRMGGTGGIGLTKPGQPLAAGVQWNGSTPQIDVFVVSNNGTLNVVVGDNTFPINVNGVVQNNFLPTSSGKTSVSATTQAGSNGSVLDVFAVDRNGVPQIYSVTGPNGGYSNTSTGDRVSPGAPFVAGASGSATWASLVLTNGSVVAYGKTPSAWSRMLLTGGTAIAGAVPTFAMQGSTMDLFAMGSGGPWVWALFSATSWGGPWPLP